MIITSVPFSYLVACNHALHYVSSKFKQQELINLAKSYRLDEDADSLVRQINGWAISSKLINTPYDPIRTWIILAKNFLNPHITKFTLGHHTLKYTLHKLDIKVELPNLNKDYELLAYYYRAGYRVLEVPGQGYNVIDIYGARHHIDLITCNCINYLSKGDCIHLQLAKAYHHNLRYLRDVSDSTYQ